MRVQEEHGHCTAGAAMWLDQAIISTLSAMSSDLPEVNRYCHKTSWTCNLHPCSTSSFLQAATLAPGARYSWNSILVFGLDGEDRNGMVETYKLTVSGP